MNATVPAPGASESALLRDLPVVSTLSRSEMGTLLALGRLALDPHSPLQVVLSGGESVVGAEPDLRDLMGSGWVEAGPPPALRADVAQALGILAAPGARLRFVLGSADGLTRMALFSGRTDSPLVRFEGERSGLWGRMEFFVEGEQLLDRVRRALDLSAGFLKPRFQVTWPWPWFLVLMALLDCYRATCLGAILDRTDPPEPALNVDRVLEALKAGLRQAHYYWAVTVAAVAAPLDMDITRAHVEAVLQEMAAAGVLREASHGVYRYGRDVQEFAASLLLMPAFLGFSRHRPGAPTVGAHLAALRGANSLWLMRFIPATDGPWQVQLSASDGESLLAALRELFTQELAPAPPVPSEGAGAVAAPPLPSADHVNCPGCGRNTRRGKFCTSCGARLVQNP